MRKTNRSLRAVTLIILLTAANVEALDWSNDEFSLYAREDKLKDVLTGLASSQSIPVEIDDSVVGTVSGVFSKTTRKVIFEQLIEAYGLVWYYDGHILYIDRLANTESRTLHLSVIHPREFKRQLIQLGVYEESDRFHWRSVENKKLIHISGPAPFVKKVSAMAEKLDTGYRSSNTIYTWTDAKGITHYSSNISDAPVGAKTIDFPNIESPTVH